MFVDSQASHDILQITAITWYVTFRLFLESNICIPGKKAAATVVIYLHSSLYLREQAEQALSWLSVSQ